MAHPVYPSKVSEVEADKMSRTEDVIRALAKAIRGGVSQRNWGATLGVTKDVVSRTESGNRLNRPYLKKLAEMPGPDSALLKTLIEEVPENRGKKFTISKRAAQIARSRGIDRITCGDDILNEIADKAKISKRRHERLRIVLDGLGRDPTLWEKSIVMGTDCYGRPCLVRSFRLKRSIRRRMESLY